MSQHVHHFYFPLVITMIHRYVGLNEELCEGESLRCNVDVNVVSSFPVRLNENLKMKISI